MSDSVLLTAALSYAGRGWAVLPLHSPNGDGSCDCHEDGCRGKHPRTKKGVKDATRDPATIRRWWAQWPTANLGLATGAASGGALVIDFESAELFQNWQKEIGDLAGRLTVQKTGRGYHAILRCEEPGGNLKLAKTVEGGTLIETRANGGCIMAAPSLHPNGKRYELAQGNLTAVSNFSLADVDRMLLAAKRFDQTPKAEPENPLAALVVKASDIAARPPTPADWLTHKFIERGELVLLAAPGGSMKSLLMLDWAVSLASGQNWLTLPNKTGGRVNKQAPVLWVNTDNSDATHEARLYAILAARDLADVPLYSLTTTDFELANPGHIRQLHTLADDLGAEVIVMDTLSGSLTGLDENSAKEMTLPAAHLRALASAGRTVVGLHHPPKNDPNGTRGSSVLPNKVDRVLTLARDGNLLTMKAMKERNRPAQLFTALAAVEFDSHETLTAVRFFDGGAAKQDQADEELRDKIREALDGEAEGLSQNKLRTAVKCRKTDLSRLLLAMRQLGEVVENAGSRGAKLYRLACPTCSHHLSGNRWDRSQSSRNRWEQVGTGNR